MSTEKTTEPTFEDVISRLKEICHLTSDAQVAMLLRLDRGNMSRLKQSNKIPEDRIKAFCYDTGASFEWLTTGTGDIKKGGVRAIDGYQGSLVVRCALKLAPLLFVRPGELRHAEWQEFDLDGASWDIPAGKMKMKLPHLVPLPCQAVTILRELQPLTGGGRWLFPSVRSRVAPMSENTVNAALRNLGFGKEVITGHGFRAMARTILDEVLGIRPDYIEQQLAHVVRDPLGRAYNRTAHLVARRAMMQQWADYLDGLKAGSGV